MIEFWRPSKELASLVLDLSFFCRDMSSSVVSFRVASHHTSSTAANTPCSSLGKETSSPSHIPSSSFASDLIFPSECALSSDGIVKSCSPLTRPNWGMIWTDPGVFLWIYATRWAKYAVSCDMTIPRSSSYPFNTHLVGAASVAMLRRALRLIVSVWVLKIAPTRQDSSP